MNSPNKKVRPVVTTQQLAYLIDLVSCDSRGSTESIKSNLLQYLKVFQMKCNLGVVSAAYSIQNKKSIDELLGDSETPAEKRENSYKLFIENPGLCTPEQINQAKTFMYENNLMTPEQEEEFENGNNF